MKKITYTIVGIIVLVIVGVAISQISSKGTSGKLVTGSDTETFSGTITAVDTGCFADATCSVTVDGKKVILVTGGRAMSPDAKVGKLIGVESIGDLEGMIGEHANVYATTTPEGDWSLYGDDRYYVEVTRTNQ